MTALPPLATKANSDAGTDDPKKALLIDLPGVVDTVNQIHAYLAGLLGTDGLPATARSTLDVEQAGASPVWPTGRGRLTFSTTAESGFILADDGTIGSAASGATTRANEDTRNLFVMLWDGQPGLVVSGGRGASATADFDANKTIEVPKILGRTLAVAGLGAGLTSRALGETLGEESHVMTESELVAHSHTYRRDFQNIGSFLQNNGTGTTQLDQQTSLTGGGQPFNVMQPTIFVNFEIAL